MLDHDLRTHFVGLMGALGPDCDISGVLGFARGREEECLGELACDPGIDQVRAGMVRLLPFLVEGDQERQKWLSATAQVLDAFPAQVASEGAPLLLRRHPAWVGLCSLEVSAFEELDIHAALRRAVDLAAVGFRALDRVDVGDGEVLWAMAEQAEDTGWTDRSRQLLALAVDADFADSANQQQVRFLAALRDLDNRGRDLSALTDVANHPASPERTRVHALWVLGQIAAENGDTKTARGHFERALTFVDHDADSEVTERIQGALKALFDEN